MTGLSEDILRDWQVRKSKTQKTRFIAFLQEKIPGLRVEEGGFPRCRNLVLGDVETADVIFTAHYDTCARLPFPNFITPKNLLLYLGYQLLILIPFFLLAGLLAALLILLGLPARLSAVLGWWIMFFAIICLFILGPANPHTVNDNTSGVLTLCELIAALSEQEKARCAFVFFDHEESGLFGSMAFASKHKKALKNRLLLNFDCVSDGDHLLFVQSKKARRLCEEALREAFSAAAAEGGKQTLIERTATAFYPSDQVNVPCGVGIAALKKKRGLGYYIDRIHTNRDTVLDENNLSVLIDGAQRFLALYHPEPDETA
ncbi:MAG: M28 family peptidase [Oscillospiraceae bacterium]|nr:M28 family peptidase [Oscillospiraceae bacterium]